MEYPRWQRFFAFLTDLFASYVFQFFGGVIGAFVASILIFGDGVTEAVVQQAAMKGFFWGTLFWGTTYWILNWIFLQGMTGATIGKHIFKLKVVQENDEPVDWISLLGRTVVMFLSVVFFGMGVIPILFSKKSQGLHDKIFKTKVISVKENELRFISDQSNDSKSQAA